MTEILNNHNFEMKTHHIDAIQNGEAEHHITEEED